MINRHLIAQLTKKRKTSKRAVYMQIAKIKKARHNTVSKEEASWILAADTGVDVARFLNVEDREKLRALMFATPSPNVGVTAPAIKAQKQVKRGRTIYLSTKNEYSLETLHPAVKQASRKLFKNGHYSDAIEKAFRTVNKHIRMRTGRTRDGGVPMMRDVFSRKPCSTGKQLRLNACKTQSEIDEHEGFGHIFFLRALNKELETLLRMMTNELQNHSLLSSILFLQAYWHGKWTNRK